MLYPVLKFIFQFALGVFFKRIRVRNRELIPADGPLLVVANHPNTMMDPVAIGAVLRQEIFFLAKSTLFGSGWRKWLMGRMHMIPIYRQQDICGSPINNEETFNTCFAFLAQHGTLLIFPEGNSFNERRLRPLKTGAARIALGAQVREAGVAGVRILPIGLNYTDPTRFRSELFINIGQPIEVREFAAVYELNPQQTAHELTGVIKSRLEALVVHTSNEEEDELVQQIEKLYKNQLLTDLQLSPNRKADTFLLTKGIIESIGYFREKAPDRIKYLQDQIQTYRVHLQQLRLRDDLLQEGKGPRNLVADILVSAVFLVLGLPIYLFGVLHNYLPYKIPALVADALTEEAEFVAPVLLTTGIFTFPVCYAIYLAAAYKWLDLGWPLLLGYALALPLSGFFVLRYWHKLRQTKGQFILLSLFYKRNTALAALMQERLDLIQTLEQAKKEYLALTTGSDSQTAPTSPAS